MNIINFGGNVKFTPKNYYTPKSEQEVLAILNKHKNGTVRVASSLHCWSNAAISNDALINLKNLNAVEIKKENGETRVTAQGGTVLQDLLNDMHKHSDCTIPTMGGITRQTIAGIVSTATHGSGTPSISHYIDEIRVAAYDVKMGEAKIYSFYEGETLKAARCALGCMGVILSVTFRAVRQYWIKERGEACTTIDEVLAHENEFPLQQFLLTPYSWHYFAYRRSVCEKPLFTARVRSFFLRLYDFLNVEMGLHLLLKSLIYFSSQNGENSAAIRWFYKSVVPRAMFQPEIINDAEHGLTLHTAHHYYFRHVEMEMFIPKSRIKEAPEAIRFVTSVFAGIEESANSPFSDALKQAGLYGEIMRNKGKYTHHYPFFFRRILPDDTLISMTEGNEPYYSVSFFTYLAPESRIHFWEYARVMALVLARLYGARPHWGKYFPLKHDDIAHLYPRLPDFRRVCKSVDPHGVFINDYAREVIGFR